MGNWKFALGLAASILLLMIVGTNESQAAAGTVKGWMKAGPDQDGYSIGTEETDQGVVAYIQSEDPEPLKYGFLMQQFTSDQFKGKRLQISAMVKAVNVQQYSGMVLRVDSNKKVVAFDNMLNRPLKGNTDWQACTIVLDVPVVSDLILMGLALQGEGKVLWKDLKLEVVGPEVKVTGYYNLGAGENTELKTKPANLDFEQ